MDFENHTKLGAALLRGDLPAEGQTLAVVVAKASGVYDAAGEMALDLDLETPVCHAPVPHAVGEVPADLALRKDGLDVMALGRAYHPDLDGGTESQVTLQVDREVRSLQVFGERSWYRSHAGHWTPSEPAPFCLLDLAWSNAFGGNSFDEWGNPCPHPLNPKGKGFIAAEAAIDGTPLANLEHPAQRITDWRDQPAPCNIAPAPRHFSADLAAMQGDIERATQRGEPFRVPDSLWNDALPLFRFHGVAPGARVCLSGMSEAPLHCTLPSLRPVAAVTVGARQLRVPLRLDTLLILPEARRALFTFRASFVYHFYPREARRAALVLEG